MPGGKWWVIAGLAFASCLCSLATFLASGGVAPMTKTVLDPTTGRDRLRLADFPTPMDHAPRLGAALGLADLHIKREDQSGYALGGNKLRQLDFILAQALAEGADTLVATAGSQSNFCRSLAGAAARLGMACHLHLRAKMGTEFAGNLLLDHVFGARVTFTQRTDPWDPAIAQELDELSATLKAKGKRPFVVQLTGVSASVGVAGWMSGAAEMIGDFDAIEARTGRRPDAVVAVCGSGLTLAGLALGFKHLGESARLIGVSAQQPKARLTDWIIATANEAAHWLAVNARLEHGDFDIIDEAIAPGYGQPSDESIAAVRLAGQTEGLVTDPIYTGKGIAGIRIGIADGRIARDSSLVFLHSGGAPGLFTHTAAFAPGVPT